MTSQIVLITGASGFVGVHLSSELASRGHTVRVLTRGNTAFHSSCEVYRCTSLSDADSIRPAFDGVGTVIHLAGRAHVMSDPAGDEAAYREVNVAGTDAVAFNAGTAGVKRVVFASSVKAIGQSASETITDEALPQPLDAYGRSKLEAENHLFERGRADGFAVNVLRFPLIYGAGVKGNIARLLAAVWNGALLPVGGITNQRTMLGVGNLCAFVAALLELPPRTELPFLVSDAESISTEQLVRLIGAGLGKKPIIVPMPPALLSFIGRVGDLIERAGVKLVTTRETARITGSLRIDSSRAWEYVGIERPDTLERGVGEMCDWYRQSQMAGAKG